MTQRVAILVCLLAATSATARAQGPYNLYAPVKNLATLFTGLYGANGLVVDSEATLPGEQPHTRISTARSSSTSRSSARRSSINS